jgi:hypothetical protein
MSFYNPRNWKYVNVKGLGLIDGIHCPHYNGHDAWFPRRREFRQMIARIGGTGIALENNCAMEFIEGRFYRVIASKPYSRAYRVHGIGGCVISGTDTEAAIRPAGITDHQSLEELKRRYSLRIARYFSYDRPRRL